MTHHITKSIIVLLAAISAITPFAIDSYLPAIPVIAKDLQSDTSLVAITVSLYILGLAIGQLIGGPLSDRFGRKPVTILGLMIVALGSLFLATVQSLEMLWIWRILQSLGAGIAVVGIPAIIRDNTVGKESAKLFGLVALITMLAPSIAPSVGTLILNTLTWHWIFIIFGFFVVLVAIATVLIMPKSVGRKKELHSPRQGGYLSILKQRQALGYLMAQAFTYAVLMTFLTNAPFVYMEHFQTSADLFALLLFGNVGVVVVVNRVNSFMLRRYEPENLLKVFLGIQCVGAILLTSLMLLEINNLWFVVIGFTFCTASIAGIMPNSSSCFMYFFSKNAGVASALLGTVQYAIAAGVSALAAMLSQLSLWPIILAILCSNLIALTGVWIAPSVKAKDELVDK